MVPPDEQELILSSEFFLKNHLDELKSVYLNLYEDRILLFIDGKFIAYVIFSLQISFNTKMNPNENGPSSLLISKDKWNNEFFLKDHEMCLNWHEKLATRMVQRDFENYYEVSRVIGNGAFSTVSLVKRIRDNNKYAMKQINMNMIFSNHENKSRLKNQLQLLRMFDHPNLMKLYEVYESDSCLRQILELVEGGTLAEYLKINPNLSWVQISSIIKQCLLGLQNMHNLRIMHRDIKPENILLRDTQTLEIVICDFELATSCDDLIYIYSQCGTPGYMAPEIINLDDGNSHYETECDIFSLGCVLYQMIFLKPLFIGNNHLEVKLENKKCEINLKFREFQALPPNVKDLITLMLQKDPSNRIKAKDALNHPFITSPNSLPPKQPIIINLSSNQEDSHNLNEELKCEEKITKERTMPKKSFRIGPRQSSFVLLTEEKEQEREKIEEEKQNLIKQNLEFENKINKVLPKKSHNTTITFKASKSIVFNRSDSIPLLNNKSQLHSGEGMTPEKIIQNSSVVVFSSNDKILPSLRKISTHRSQPPSNESSNTNSPLSNQIPNNSKVQPPLINFIQNQGYDYEEIPNQTILKGSRSSSNLHTQITGLGQYSFVSTPKSSNSDTPKSQTVEHSMKLNNSGITKSGDLKPYKNLRYQNLAGQGDEQQDSPQSIFSQQQVPKQQSSFQSAAEAVMSSQNNQDQIIEEPSTKESRQIYNILAPNTIRFNQNYCSNVNINSSNLNQNQPVMGETPPIQIKIIIPKTQSNMVNFPVNILDLEFQQKTNKQNSGSPSAYYI